MAHGVSFNLDILDEEEEEEHKQMSKHLLFSEDISPCDESAMHDSFKHLIEEQRRLSEECSEVIEMEQMQDMGKEDLCPVFADDSEDSFNMECMPHDAYSSMTLRILSSMPSRTIGRSKGAIISQCYNKTMKLQCRKRRRPAIFERRHSSRPSIRQYDLDNESQEEDKKMKLLKAELQKLSWSQQGYLLQQQPLSLSEKQELRNKDSAHENFIRKTDCKCEIPCCTRLKYSFLTCLRRTSYEFISFTHTLHIWQYSFKQIGGRFGSSVLSYFLFLRTLLHFSAFLFLLNVLFIVIPQAVYPPRVNSSSFTGLELLTGAGHFTSTVLFYGYYTNSTINKISTPSKINASSVAGTTLRLPYNMPLAYVFTVGVSFFITCIILVYSMSKSFGRVFRVSGTYKDLATMVFCCWDFKVIQKRPVMLQHENISTQLKELLGEMAHKAPKLTILQKLRKLTVLFVTWGVCLGSVTGCVVAVYYLSTYLHQERLRSGLSMSTLQSEASLLILPLTVSFINLFLPYLYNLLEIAERQESPALQVYIAMSRNLLLKMMMLGMLCYHWLAQVPPSEHIQCWETFVGQEFYRFIIIDFIFALLDTLFGEFVWRHMSQKWLRRERKPEFDIARNVLELIYGQTLTWLGVLFSPLLPAVQMIKLFLLFYIKKTSLMMNCKSPSKPWRACHMSTVFITLLCFPSFLGAAVATTYSIWSIKPSMECGPFRTLSTIYESGKTWVRNLEEDNPRFAWFSWIHKYIVENPVFLFMIAGILLIAIYFHMQVVDGQRKIIKLLRVQIANEGEDKKFLINRLQTIYFKQKKEKKKAIMFSTE